MTEKTITLLLIYFRLVRSPQEIFRTFSLRNAVVKRITNRGPRNYRNPYLAAKTSKEAYFTEENCFQKTDSIKSQKKDWLVALGRSGVSLISEKLLDKHDASDSFCSLTFYALNSADFQLSLDNYTDV